RRAVPQSVSAAAPSCAAFDRDASESPRRRRAPAPSPTAAPRRPTRSVAGSWMCPQNDESVFLEDRTRFGAAQEIEEVFRSRLCIARQGGGIDDRRMAAFRERADDVHALLAGRVRRVDD